MLLLRQLQITRNVLRPWIDHQVFGMLGQIPEMGELE